MKIAAIIPNIKPAIGNPLGELFCFAFDKPTKAKIRAGTSKSNAKTPTQGIIDKRNAVIPNIKDTIPQLNPAFEENVFLPI